MPGVVAYIDQRTQLAQETVAGTPVAAGKRMQQVAFAFGDEVDTTQFNPTGHRFDSLSLLNKVWTSLKGSGPVSYTEFLYLIEAMVGAASPSTQGVNGKLRSYDIPLTGALSPKTLTTQFGDDTYANQAAYAFFPSLGAKYVRDSGAMLDGVEGIAQRILTGGVTFTPAPTTVALSPVIGPHQSFYLDSTGAGLGGTQITEEVLEASWNLKDILKVFWAADRSQTSWKKPLSNESGKYTAKLSLGESSVTRAIDAALMLGRTYFLRIENKGDMLDNQNVLTITGTPTGGTFTLTYKGQTTGAIAYNATNTTVQTALAALSTIGAGNVVVTGGPGPGTPWTVNFVSGLLQNDSSVITHADSFAGGASPALAIVQTLTPYEHTVDVAIKLMKKAAWANKGSVYARDFDFTIAEDATWAHALMLKSVTGLASL
jgi:hypothetical protein